MPKPNSEASACRGLPRGDKASPVALAPPPPPPLRRVLDNLPTDEEGPATLPRRKTLVVEEWWLACGGVNERSFVEALPMIRECVRIREGGRGGKMDGRISLESVVLLFVVWLGMEWWWRTVEVVEGRMHTYAISGLIKTKTGKGSWRENLGGGDW